WSERQRPDALFVGGTAFLNIRRVQLVQLAAFHRLPATYAQREAAEAGGLMTYGPSVLEGYRQLRARRERPRSRTAEHRDELAAPHWTTSSAGASSIGGSGASFPVGDNMPNGCDQPIELDRFGVELVAPRRERLFTLAGECMC